MHWPSWIPPEASKKATVTVQEIDGAVEKFKAQFHTLPRSVVALMTFTLGSVATLSSVLMYKRYGRRIRHSEWVTPKLLTRKRWLKGVVTSVGDADNFRFFHTPTFGGYSWPLKFRRIPSLSKDLKNETLHIRIAGVDAPEAGHFGKPPQPYAAESLAWLRNRILGKKVYVQLLRKDQYSRIVAQVYLTPRILPGFLFYGKNLPVEMLKAGWAVIYEQAGAEYGKLGKEGYLRLEAQAKAARRGMWKDGVNAETPAQYKLRHASAASLEEAEAAKPTARKKKGAQSWLIRLFS
ncbi:SNase-domain-containing protein [Pholiota conissans]|uniref:SNase-domain-containing protein n=1 Tax=Pholiota conissans TaxID=109636 RepID=A0A9P5YWU1_9AGAR|nr:SNase-domain-containing protein [Pholiota conissans]